MNAGRKHDQMALIIFLFALQLTSVISKNCGRFEAYHMMAAGCESLCGPERLCNIRFEFDVCRCSPGYARNASGSCVEMKNCDQGPTAEKLIPSGVRYLLDGNIAEKNDALKNDKSDKNGNLNNAQQVPRRLKTEKLVVEREREGMRRKEKIPVSEQVNECVQEPHENCVTECAEKPAECSEESFEYGSSCEDEEPECTDEPGKSAECTEEAHECVTEKEGSCEKATTAGNGPKPAYCDSHAEFCASVKETLYFKLCSSYFYPEVDNLCELCAMKGANGGVVCAAILEPIAMTSPSAGGNFPTPPPAYCSAHPDFCATVNNTLYAQLCSTYFFPEVDNLCELCAVKGTSGGVVCEAILEPIVPAEVTTPAPSLIGLEACKELPLICANIPQDWLIFIICSATTLEPPVEAMCNLCIRDPTGPACAQLYQPAEQ